MNETDRWPIWVILSVPIVQALLVAVLSYVARTMTQATTRITRMETQLTDLRATMDERIGEIRRLVERDVDDLRARVAQIETRCVSLFRRHFPTDPP